MYRYCRCVGFPKRSTSEGTIFPHFLRQTNTTTRRMTTTSSRSSRASCFHPQKQKHRRLFSRSSFFLLETHHSRPRPQSRRHRTQQRFVVVVNSSTTRRETDPNNSELLLVAVAVGVTTGLAVSAFNLCESHVHRSVFDFTFQTFLVAPTSETTIEQTTTPTDVVLNKFQTLSQNSGNASFVSHSLQVIVPTLGGCVVSALRDVAGGSFLGEEAVGTATSRAASSTLPERRAAR